MSLILRYDAGRNKATTMTVDLTREQMKSYWAEHRCVLLNVFAIAACVH